MPKGNMYIVNMEKVVKDFRDYDKDTQKRLSRTLKKWALEVKDRSGTLLTRRIIHKDKTTGVLASSIHPEQKSKLTWWIAPLDEIKYGPYVETGKPSRGNFKGHHFLRDTVKRIRKPFEADLKKDIPPR
jgi:hypothetical protein